MKLNIGGQKRRIDGPFRTWTIVDTRKGSEVRMDIMETKLPMRDNSVNAIYTSHTLEHLFADRIPFVLKQCHRVLKPGHLFRVVVPDVDIAIKAYVNGDSEFLRDGEPSKQSCLPEFDLCYLSSWFFTFKAEKKSRKRLVGGHVMVFNLEVMTHYLEEAGFKNLRKLEYQNCDPIFAGCDFKRYRNCSLYIECEK